MNIPEEVPTFTGVRRFDAKIQSAPGPLDTECWEWTGANDGQYGYGRVYFEGRTSIAHRVIYKSIRGAVDDDIKLDHLCRNPPCCNPDHLEPVTHAENLRRGAGSTRDGLMKPKEKCIRGHAMTPENTILYKGARKGCKECRRANNAKHYQRKSLNGALVASAKEGTK